jgi:hypothetical protein
VTRAARRTLLAALLAVVVIAAPACAFFTAPGTGTRNAAAATLTGATLSAPATAVNNVTVTWATQGSLSPSVPSADATITYKVQRKLGAGAYADVASGGCSGTKTYGTTSCTDAPGVAGTYYYRVVSTYRTSWTDTSAPTSGVAVTIDTTAPTVSSVNRAATSPTNASSVSWTVTFSESVTGVDATDFSLARTGTVAGGTITSVTGSGTTYTVTASTGSGTGNYGLNLVDDDSITDAGANPLAGIGAGNGNLTGQVYALDLDAPTATLAIGAASPSAASSLTWNVTFTESVTGVNAADFAVAQSGVTGATVSTVTGSGTSYVVTVATGSGSGTLGLNLLSDGTVKDAAGNVAPTATGATYTMDRTAPALVSMLMQDTNNNGKVDHVVATFNETLATSTLTTNWTLANVPSGGTLSSVATSGTTATLTLTEGASAANTAVGTFTLALAANASGVKDALGNQSSFAATAPSDGAKPVPTALTDNDTGVTTNGKVAAGDTMSVTFSEALAPASVTAATTVTESRPASGNATLSVPSFTNGALGMGATAYLTAASTSIVLAGTNSLGSGNTVLTVTVGACSTGCTNAGQNLTNASFTYTPATTLTDPAGNAAAGSFTLSNRLF